MTTNCTTHTATVHASRVHADGRLVPACFSNSQVAELHYSAPTDRDVTCKRCLAGVETKAEAAAAKSYAALRAELDTPKAAVVATVSLAATINGVQIVRHADEDGVIWTLHNSGPAFFAAFTLKEAKAVAAR